MYASCLKTNRLDNPMGIDPGAVYVSWVCREGVCQSAFQITVDGDVQFDSGKLCSCKTEYALPISIPSRAACRWSVTLWDENDRRGEPRQACFETGLSPEDWVASWIDPEPEDLIPAQDNQSLNTASYLRRKFFCAPAEKARLYITAHGIYDVWINGIHVDGYFLAPGSGQYDQRLQAQTYDVAALLKSGENEILVSIGDGWWRGCFGWAMRRNCWGDRLALLCQLEVDGALVLCSDATWQASQNGPLGLNDPMQLQSPQANRGLAWRSNCGFWLR